MIATLFECFSFLPSWELQLGGFVGMTKDGIDLYKKLRVVLGVFVVM